MMSSKRFLLIYKDIVHKTTNYLNSMLSEVHEEQLIEWKKKFDALGQDLVSRVNERYQGEKSKYDGVTFVVWPKRYVNKILFHVRPINHDMRGKPILTLCQRHNGRPYDTIEVILQSEDAGLSGIAEDSIRSFNRKEETNFDIKHYDGSRMDKIKYRRK